MRRPETAAGPRKRLVRGARRGARQGAVLTAELLFVLPVLVLLLLALVEFTMFITAQTRVAAASREGARTAALGGSSTDVQNAVCLILGSALCNTGQVDIQINYLNETKTDPGNEPGNPVQVVVSVPATLLVPNLLSRIYFNLCNATLCAQTTMIIE